MNIDTLIAEANALARPVTYLIPNGTGPIVAGWWGPTSRKQQDEATRWLALDCAAFPSLRIASGTFVVYEQMGNYFTVVDKNFSWSDIAGSQTLYAAAGQSLPPVEGLFRFGSERIGGWLADLGWQREWEYNRNFPDAAAQEYDEIYQGQHPLYNNSAWAAVGGWHFPWPDGDWEERLADRLLLTTFHESEPWLEVWETGNRGIQVYARIT